MASVFKRGRWVDSQGRKCSKNSLGAKWVESRFYTVAVVINGRTKRIKGFTDRGASEQLGSQLERSKARGETGLTDIYKPHRERPLAEHVADWITELRQVGRDEVYVGLCECRMSRLIAECKWETFKQLTADSFIVWRQTATSTVGTAHKKGSNVKSMAPRTQNHYVETVRAFANWAIKRKRLEANPVKEVSLVETVGRLRRERRALNEVEVAALLAVVPERHQLAYRMILSTGLRRDELRQLRWGDVKLNATIPFIQLRAETTKGKRPDTPPLRADLAALLRKARGEADDGDRVFRSLPSMISHRGYLAKAGITYLDEQGRRADFHSLRHTFGTMLSKAGVSPREAMSLMRHSDMRLTMNVYTDPRIFNLAGAVEKLSIPAGNEPKEAIAIVATGTDGKPADLAENFVSDGNEGISSDSGWRESVTSPSALIGHCSAVIGEQGEASDATITPVIGGNWQQKTPSGGDWANERAKGVEPSTSGLESLHSAN